MSQTITKCRHHPYSEERSPLEILVPSGVVSLTLLFFFLWFQPDKVQSLESSRWLRVTGGLVLISFAIMSISQYLLLRTSLNRVEKLLRKHPAIFRCHRTAIVNLRNVKSASGNSQGYQLKLKHIDQAVPVARSRVHSFRNVLFAIQR
ncbi:MAG: LytTR family DNA-binding domain-containing protein [bacterium]